MPIIYQCIDILQWEIKTYENKCWLIDLLKYSSHSHKKSCMNNYELMYFCTFNAFATITSRVLPYSGDVPRLNMMMYEIFLSSTIDIIHLIF